MKAKLILLVIVVGVCLSARAQYVAVSGNCELPGQAVVVSGLVQSGTQPLSGSPFTTGSGVMASYPQCLVTVYPAGSGTPVATGNVYSSSTGTVLGNPFTANTDGSWLFYAAAGCYDVNLSSGAGPANQLPATKTLSGKCAGGLSGAVTSITAGTGLTASPNPITSSGTIGIASVVTAGSCTNCNITYNAYGQVTIASNGSAGSGVTGSGAAPYFPIFTNSSGAAVLGNSSLQAVTSPNGVQYATASGQYFQLDSGHLSWNTGVSGSSNIVIQNTYAPGSSNNAGGIILEGAPATGSACAGNSKLLGAGTNGLSNGGSVLAYGGCSNGFGATGGGVTIFGGNTSASNTGGTIVLQPGTGGFGNGTVNISGLSAGCLNISSGSVVGSYGCVPITSVTTPLAVASGNLTCTGCATGKVVVANVTGLLIETGTLTGNGTGGTVTFSQAFSATPNITATGNGAYVNVLTKSASGFTYGYGSTNQMDWIAIGAQ